MTDEHFAALERRLAHVEALPSSAGAGRDDVLALLAECRRLREPPDVSGLMTAAALESLHRYVGSQEGHWLAPAVDHIDAQAALVRELYGVVADLHAEDPGRQALLGRGAAEMLHRVLALTRESFGDPAAADYPGLADALGRLRALGPSRPPLPPQEAEREAERLREALLACVRAVGQVTRAEPAGSMGGLVAAYEAARAALGEGAR
jgi:hypothetical protein